MSMSLSVGYQIFRTLNVFNPSFTSVRFLQRRSFIRRYGYTEPWHTHGVLPRFKDSPKNKVATVPEYRPKDSWHEKRALFGQNDYIDILGDGSLHPVKLLTNVPSWLKGFKGNEFQMLLRKRSHLRSIGGIDPKHPCNWRNLNKRINFLYKFLNRKTPT